MKDNNTLADDLRERIAQLEALIREGRLAVAHAERGSTHWEGCEQHHIACAWLKKTDSFESGRKDVRNAMDTFMDADDILNLPAETPVSTLCAICDQIKELHPSTHPWTARVTVENEVTK